MHITPRRALLVPASTLALLALGPAYFHGTFADATVDAHRARQTELTTASEAIIAQADAERRELSVEEQGSIQANAAEVDRLEAQIALRERVTAQADRLGETRGRQTAPEETPGDAQAREGETNVPQNRTTAAAPRQTSLAPVPAQPRATAAGTGGFRNFGDFASAVRNASLRGAEPDRRLLNAAASTMSQESVGADGGFAIPPDFRAEIQQRVFAEDSLLGRCDLQVSNGNTFTAPVDETTPWGTGGIKAYWEGEAAAITQSKPQLREVSVRLHKLAGLVPVTEEMLEDSAQIDGYLRSKLPEAIDWAASYAIAWGTGAGQPQGYMNSASLVTVAAESGQTADTIVAANAVKMMARMPTRSRPTAVWLIHPDAEPQLPLMTIGQQPVYLPPGGLAGNQYGTLLGRPVIPHQVCKTVGDLGDIQLVDLKQYLAVRKASGIRLQVSMHLWFDQDLQAFKATLRLAGQSWWSAAMANKDGSNSLSPFVTLAAR